MKKLFLLLVMLISFTQASLADEPIVPDVFLKSSLDEVVNTLNGDPSILRDPKKMEAYVSERILTQFDIALLSKSIVGEQIWDKASTGDQDSLTSEMNVFFRHMIAKTLSEFDNQTLAYDETTLSGDKERAAITGRVLDKKDETVPFKFRLIKNASTWKIYDVTLGGVDLIFTYKSNFKPILEEGGVAKLAAELHKKNLAVAAIK
jgi:phospholipid transport system substrate-binding protein